MSAASQLSRTPKHISANLIIPQQCQERFLATPSGGANAFRNADLDYAGISNLVSGYDVTRIGCWHHVLLFTISGSGQLDSNGKTWKLGPGSLCILPAGKDHHYFSSKSWHIVWMHPKPTSLWDSLIGSIVEVRPFLFGHRILSLAELLWSELASNDVDAKEAARMSAQLMLHYAHRELKQAEDILSRNWRLKLEAIWEKAYAEPNLWNVAAVAESLHCSRTHLHEICGQLYDQTVGEKLVQIRIQRAADLLRHTPWTLRDIAGQVGYADAFAFSKAFRRTMKMPPTEYRNSAG